ncbi:hypothetical protein DO70_5325 [Burkholderia pseudomallei]|nr:hypothetical protein DO70_5325 [Burkholderia pseudomallei]
MNRRMPRHACPRIPRDAPRACETRRPAAHRARRPMHAIQANGKRARNDLDRLRHMARALAFISRYSLRRAGPGASLSSRCS